jgi:hypothetical protein
MADPHPINRGSTTPVRGVPIALRWRKHHPFRPGGTVARSKRTDRAEARRRYRATLTESPVDDDLEIEDEVAAEVERPPVASRGRAPATSATPTRPSIGGAFRASFRPLDIGADLRGLPRLVTHKSVWVPVLLTVGAAALYAVVTPPAPANAPAQGSVPFDQVIASLLFQYFVFTPPVASIFLAGFMAPRASYLTGGIAGLVGGIAFALVVLARVGPFVQLDDIAIREYATSGLAASPLAGVFFGGAAGWYRRFLTLANPGRATANRPGGKPNDRSRRRGPDGRPLLARRR